MARMPQAQLKGTKKPIDLQSPVQYVKGVGPRRSEELNAHLIHTVGDLLEYAPFRYEDRTQFRPLKSLREEEWVLTRGVICSVSSFDGEHHAGHSFESAGESNSHTSFDGRNLERDVSGDCRSKVV